MTLALLGVLAVFRLFKIKPYGGPGAFIQPFIMAVLGDLALFAILWPMYKGVTP